MNNSVSFVPAFILIILSSLSIVILEQTELIKVHAQKQVVTTNEKNDCINYNSATKQILISCKSKTVTLTDISNQINNYGILDKQPQGVWLLNANLVINNGSILNIDPTDTKWLKIITDEKTPAYGIYVHGGLKIDKVKITSWNPRTNTYALSNGSRENSGPSNCYMRQRLQ